MFVLAPGTTSRILRAVTHVSILCVLPLGIGACERRSNLLASSTSPETVLHAEWISPIQQFRPGPTTLHFRLKQTSGVALRGAKVVVEGNMTHPGMVPVYATAVETEPGRYIAKTELTMAGEWVFFLEATTPEGKLLNGSLNSTVAP